MGPRGTHYSIPFTGWEEGIWSIGRSIDWVSSCLSCLQASADNLFHILHPLLLQKCLNSFKYLDTGAGINKIHRSNLHGGGARHEKFERVVGMENTTNPYDGNMGVGIAQR